MEEHQPPSPSKALDRGLELLLRATKYAEDVDCDRWEFAVEIGRLLELGLTVCELRWLVGRKYVECAREITQDDTGPRSFGEPAQFALRDDSCFVLSKRGEYAIRDSAIGAMGLSLVSVPSNIPADAQTSRPNWNQMRRTLTVGDVVVKRYRVPAENQERILGVFEEEGWPERIDDPLSPIAEHDPKRRLQSAIMCLNRNQRNPLLRFRGDGSGMGVLWEHAACTA